MLLVETQLHNLSEPFSHGLKKSRWRRHSLISDDIGKFKLEYQIKEGFFIAPKVYMIVMNDDSNKVVVKGLKKKSTQAIKY